MSIKPLPRKTRVENRGYHYSKTEDKTKNITVTLQDIDSAILYYFEKVINPSVEDNGENIKVPVLYGSVERWKSVLKDGYLRDKKNQIITPVIIFKRNTININESIPQDKLDANNPNLLYPFQQKYSQENRYDRLSTQINTVSQREYYNATFPDFIDVSYSFIIWTSYIEQMNKIVEKVNYSDGAYWGEPNKMKFKSKITTFEDTTEITETERLVRTDFELEISGYVLLEQGFDNSQTTEKYITPKKINFISEVVVNDV